MVVIEKLKEIIHKLFEIDQEKITLEAKFYEDLDLDSIDAVDLIVHLQTLVNKKFSPQDFKAVRTIGDIVDVLYVELSKNES